MAFVDELARHGDRVSLRPQDEYGLLDLAGTLAEVPADTLVYCCGPEPLLLGVEQVMAHWPIGSLHIERFTQKIIARTEPDTELGVEFAASGVSATVPAGKSIRTVAEENGVTALFSCQEGTCGTCEIRPSSRSAGPEYMPW